MRSRHGSTIFLRLGVFVCVCVIGASNSTALAADSRATPQKTAVTRGLAWLAANQGKDGGFAAANHAGVAVTSLAGMAFLASGSDPGKGEYGKPLAAAAAYVLAHQDKATGLISIDDKQGPVMYGHGYATLFLCELYLRNRDPSTKQAIENALALLNRSASKEGGWRYLPRPIDADVSVTACELNALLAARAAGIAVDARVIENAIAYVNRCQIRDGGFTYMAGQGPVGRSGLPRSAAAVAVVLHGGAAADNQDVNRGISYVTPFVAAEADSSPGEGHYWYGAYYASQWLPAAGDQAHQAYTRLSDQIVAGQKPDGSWADPIGPEYATACALLVLQAPDRRLWIYRGGR